MKSYLGRGLRENQTPAWQFVAESGENLPEISLLHLKQQILGKMVEAKTIYGIFKIRVGNIPQGGLRNVRRYSIMKLLISDIKGRIP